MSFPTYPALHREVESATKLQMNKWTTNTIAVSLSALALTGRNTASADDLNYLDVRLAVIRSQLSQAKNPIVIMGDSIVESAPLPQSVCGHPVINAGVRGARVGFFAERASQILDGDEPTLTVLAVGINDALNGDDVDTFRVEYAAALQAIPSPVVIATIVAATPIKPIEIKHFNDVITELAGDSGLIDLHGTIPGGLTVDGVHLNGEGYRLWTKELLTGIQHALGCIT